MIIPSFVSILNPCVRASFFGFHVEFEGITWLIDSKWLEFCLDEKQRCARWFSVLAHGHKCGFNVKSRSSKISKSYASKHYPDPTTSISQKQLLFSHLIFRACAHRAIHEDTRHHIQQTHQACGEKALSYQAWEVFGWTTPLKHVWKPFRIII